MSSVKNILIFSVTLALEPAILLGDCSNASVLPWIVHQGWSAEWIDTLSLYLSHDYLCQASMDDGSLGSADDTEEIISPPKSRTTSQGAPSPMPPSRDQVAIVTFLHSIRTLQIRLIDDWRSREFWLYHTLIVLFFSYLFSIWKYGPHALSCSCISCTSSAIIS